VELIFATVASSLVNDQIASAGVIVDAKDEFAAGFYRRYAVADYVSRHAMRARGDDRHDEED
jgi:hypothetical protein